MPVEQAEVLADESTRLVGEQVATKQDIALLRTDLELRGPISIGCAPT